MHVPLSVLDLAPVPTGTPAAECVRRTVDLARLADELGYQRYWFAEHHSLPSVASSSPEVLIAHVAAHTERIRVGSGGIMLPNHTPLRIAEAFHTLSALYPGRIDLGLGRAPGSEQVASKALRAFDGNSFSSLMSELIALTRSMFPAGHPFGELQVMPADAASPPMWILGSSGASATSAGRAGLGYAYATHFTADPPGPPIGLYKEAFTPSAEFPAPHAIIAVAVVCAETNDRAERLASTMDLAWLRIERGAFSPLPSPEEVDAYPFDPSERHAIARRRPLVVIGDPRSVREQLERRLTESGADEIMVVTNVWSHEARLHSYRLLAKAFS
ncbi:MAG TPA: LLM class flavin-dependent oxidoreductase [Sporichthyaceae bacterium]|nr:LLM class flavin-dependent oxidoreductase [Sporichthyaceae bacterium]